MTRVRQYSRITKGKRHLVSSHNRRVIKRKMGYRIVKHRILQPGRTEHGWDNDFIYDRVLHAESPGKRTSTKGNTYYERRFNRSDDGHSPGL